MATSKQAPATQVPSPPETFWFMRWLQEMEAPRFDAGAGALEDEEKNVLAVAQMAAHPWTLFGAQLAMVQLALLHVGAAQAEWMDAWCKAWSDLAPSAAEEGADRRPASPLDPFGWTAQAQAFAGRCVDQWAALARSGPFRIA